MCHMSHGTLSHRRDSRLPGSGRRCNDMSGLATVTVGVCEAKVRLRYAEDCESVA